MFPFQDLLSVLSRPDHQEAGDRGLTRTDKMTLYTFLQKMNQSRNNKVMAKVPPVSGERSVDRLQEPLMERSKHEHEENSLHDHWGEAEHSHTHQVMPSPTSRRILWRDKSLSYLAALYFPPASFSLRLILLD